MATAVGSAPRGLDSKPATPLLAKKPPTAAKKSTLAYLLAGATAGGAEALACHPLDTIKVHMQLSKSPSASLYNSLVTIVRTSGPTGLYRGLSSVLTFIGPKMGVRFASFEAFKSALDRGEGVPLGAGRTLLAGLGAGVVEAVAVVTPMEVVKIRLQSQSRTGGELRYRNAVHALVRIGREEGVRGLYRGVGLTALRQGTNQMVNLSVYTHLKSYLSARLPEGQALPTWQTLLIGLAAGASGPCCNAPIDTIKTRLQRTAAEPGQSGLSRVRAIAGDMWREEGVRALFRGVTPRVLRVGPGQAVAYCVYERVLAWF